MPRVTIFNGTTFLPLPPGLNGAVHALIIADPDGTGPLGECLIAGGAFSRSGPATVSRVARFDGANWQPIGPGLGGTVNTLLSGVIDNQGTRAVFAGGAFTRSGTQSIARLARWVGAQRQPEIAPASPADVPVGETTRTDDIIAFFDAFADGC